MNGVQKMDLYSFRSDIQNLPSILLLGGTFKRRPNIHGAWIKSREEKLGHRIIPFKPELEKDTIREEMILVGYEI